MSVAIRLSRKGTKNKPSYRIIVIPARSKREGKFIEILGYYDPLLNPPKVKVERARLDYWLSCGAQPSEAVKKILKF